MSAARSPRIERRPEARAQELLDAALRVFAQKGYRNARLDDVAEAAGATKGAIYHYFATKEALLLGVIEHYHALAFGRAEEALQASSMPASARIRLLMRKVFAPRPEGPGDYLLTLLVRDVASEVPHVHDAWLANGPVRLWTLIASLVEEGQRRGEFRADADGEIGARLLVSGVMLQRMWRQHAATVPGLPVDDDRLIDSSTELFLASLRVTGALPGAA